MSAEAPRRNPWTAAILGLLLGQLGYAYTRQSARMLISVLLGTLAIGLACAVALHQTPTLFDPTTILDDPLAWEHQVLAAIALPSFVATLNNVVCAVDLYFQAIALNARSAAGSADKQAGARALRRP